MQVLFSSAPDLPSQNPGSWLMQRGLLKKVRTSRRME
jgi:hypothetical protein